MHTDGKSLFVNIHQVSQRMSDSGYLLNYVHEVCVHLKGFGRKRQCKSVAKNKPYGPTRVGSRGKPRKW